MPIQRLLTGALLCALLPAFSASAKELRGLQSADDEVAKALPVQVLVLVLQSHLRPQFRYNYLATSAGASTLATTCMAAEASATGRPWVLAWRAG